MNPRVGRSPPELPTTTLSLTTSGAAMSAWPALKSSTTTSHTTRPVLRSNARRCAVERGHEEPIAERGEAAVRRVAGAVGEARRERPAIAPDLPARAGVDRPRHVVVARDVEHAVHAPAAWTRSRGRSPCPRPGRSTARRGDATLSTRDLLQRAMAAAGVVAGIREPPRRMLQAVEQVLRRDQRQHRRRQRRQPDRRRRRLLPGRRAGRATDARASTAMRDGSARDHLRVTFIALVSPSSVVRVRTSGPR